MKYDLIVSINKVLTSALLATSFCWVFVLDRRLGKV